MRGSSIFFIIFIVLGILSACGKQESGTSGTTALVDPNNYKSGECGSNVLRDIYQINLHCGHMVSQSGIDSCKHAILEFKYKYPGINCKAPGGEKTGLEAEIIVTDQWVSDLVTEVMVGQV